IFKMLKRVKKDGKGLIKASTETAELVFIDCHSYKAQCIRIWTKYWLQNAQLPPTFQGELSLRKKEYSRLIIISEFLTKAYEWLKLYTQAIENYPNIPKEAYVYLIRRKNQEGYWIMNHLLEQ
ncbi:10579_t:CDS:2, partial [Funneliformis geosporum]